MKKSDQNSELRLVRNSQGVSVQPIEAKGDDFTRVQITFSSETPVARFFGTEILEHSAEAIDFDRLNRQAPLLINHDTSDQAGVVERAWLGDDRRGHAIVRFSRSDRGQEIAQDLLDGVRPNISVGYLVNDMVRTISEDGEIYHVTSWTPFELSVVAIPADQNVGFGRKFEDRFGDPQAAFRSFDSTITGSMNMTTESEQPTRRERQAAREAEQAAKEERNRVQTIARLGRKYDMGDEADDAIENDLSVREFQDLLLDKIERNAVQPPRQSFAPSIHTSGERQFSIAKAINAKVNGDWKHAGYEREVSAELEKKAGRQSRGFFVPFGELMTRDTTYAGSGGNLVGTDHLGGSFIDVLRNQSVVMAAGAHNLPGLEGNVTIPRKSASATAEWLDGETEDVTPSDPTFNNITLEPHVLAAMSSFSHRMLRQSAPGIEQIIRNDLAAVIATETDRAALNGSGTTTEPRGIINTAGVNADTYTTAPDYADVLAALGALGADNADSSLSWVTTPTLGYSMAGVSVDTGSGRFLVDIGNSQQKGAKGSILNQPMFFTQNMPAGTILVGNFQELVVGWWGTLEIEVDPYGSNFSKGSVSVRAIVDVDFGVRHPEAFCVLTAA